MSEIDGIIEHQPSFVPSEYDQFYTNHIMQRRIYDLLAIIALGLNKEQAEMVIQAHEQGIIIGSDPSWAVQAATDADWEEAAKMQEDYRRESGNL